MARIAKALGVQLTFLLISIGIQFLATAPALAQEAHDMTPRHGGQVVMGVHGHAELVVDGAVLRVYVSHHDGSPMPGMAHSGSAIVLGADGTASEPIPLSQDGDALIGSAAADIVDGSSVIVTLTHGAAETETLEFAL